MDSHRHIYWVTPAIILGPFVLAIALAVGHHCFYGHLAGQVAPTGNYSIAVAAARQHCGWYCFRLYL